jgi:transcriptional regulator with XRE-family HTH domain
MAGETFPELDTLRERAAFLCDRVARARGIRKLSTHQIAKEINEGLRADGSTLTLAPSEEHRSARPLISQGSVSVVLRGEGNPTLRIFALLEAYFACPEGYLRNRRGDEARAQDAGGAAISHLQVVRARLPFMDVDQLEDVRARADELIRRHRAGELEPNRLERRHAAGGQT